MIRIYFFVIIVILSVTFSIHSPAQMDDKPIENKTGKLVWSAISSAADAGITKTVYTYDDHKRILTETTHQLDSITLKITSKKQRLNKEFDAHGNIKSKTIENFFDDKWNNISRILYEYDSIGNNIVVINQNWENGWDNFIKTDRIYDSNSNLMSETKLFWKDSDWMNLERQTMTYNSKNLLLVQINQIYTSKWENQQKTVNVYDSTGNKIMNSEYRYQTDWIELSRTVYKYNEKNLKIEIVTMINTNDSLSNSGKQLYQYDQNNNNIYWLSQMFRDGKWQNSIQTTNTFDSRNLLKTSIVELWDSTSWKHQDMTAYTYNENSDVISKTISNDIGGNWKFSMRDTFAYNKYNQQIIHLFERYVAGAWQTQLENVYEFDSEGDIVKIKYQKFDTPTNKEDKLLGFISNQQMYQNFCYSVEISYDPSTGADERKEITSKICLYPNPSGDFITVSFQGQFASGDIQIKIYNLMSVVPESNENFKFEKSEDGNYSLRYNISNLRQGIYFLRIGKELTSFVKIK